VRQEDATNVVLHAIFAMLKSGGVGAQFFVVAGTRSSIRVGETRVGPRRPDRAFSDWRGRRCRRARGRNGARPELKRIRLTSTAPRLLPPARDSRGREDVRRAMIGIAEIVERVILHAQRMLDDGAYDWPTSRAALERILADLEARSVDDPRLERLRRFIALGDDAWKARHGRGRRHGARRGQLDL
jgi:hypothetical protein